MRIICCLLLAACTEAAPPKASEPRAADNTASKSRFELPSGLFVVVQENHSVPVVAVQAWVRAGTADEEPGEDGCAQLLERLLIDSAMYRRIEALGGTLTVRAGYDYTWVQAVISHRDVQTGADLVGKALTQITDAEFDHSLSTLKDDARRSAIIPAQRLSSALFDTVYTTHPYRRSLQPSEDALKQLTRDKIARFHDKHFKPNNTVVVITGDTTPEEARRVVAQSFKGYHGKASNKTARPSEPAQTAARIKLVEFPTSDAYLSVAWPIPGIDHPDATALSLLAVVLGQGHGSRLAERLKGGLAMDVYGFSYTPNGPGLLAAGFVAEAKHAEEASGVLLAEVDRLRREVVSESELLRSKAIVLGDTYYNNATVEGRASKAGFFQAALGDASVEDRFGSEIDKISVADLKRVAGKYLSAKRLTLVALVPKSCNLKGDEILATANAFEAAYAAREHIRLPAPGRMSVYRVKLPSGTTVLLQPDHSVPIVSVRAAFIGGQRYEDKSTSGIHALLSRTLTKATERHSAKEVADMEERLAADIDGFATQNAFGLYAEFLKSTSGEGLDLLAEMLTSPRFAAQDVDRERAVLLSEIRSREDHAPTAVFDLFTEALYDQHPYRLRQRGSVDAVGALRENELARFYKRTYTRDKLVVAIVGDFAAEDMLAQVSRLFGAPRDRGESPKPPAAEPPLDKARLIERSKDKAQAVAVLGFRGAALGDKDRYALELLSTILGGHGGRLARALKDKIAQEVASVSVAGLEPGYFAAYLTTSPDRLDGAIDALKKELQQLQDTPVQKDELERARRYLLGTHAISLQRGSARAASLALHELFGNGFDEDATFDDLVESVSAEDVQRVAKDYLDLKKCVLAVIKPGNK